jgi:transglutaminase/protease-like cytokinesis protein 3
MKLISIIILLLVNQTDVSDLRKLFEQQKYAKVLKEISKIEKHTGDLYGSNKKTTKKSVEFLHYKLYSNISINGYRNLNDNLLTYSKLYKVDTNKVYANNDKYIKLRYYADSISTSLLSIGEYKKSKKIVDLLAVSGDTTETYKIVYGHKRSLIYNFNNLSDIKTYNYDKVDSIALSVKHKPEISTVVWLLTKDLKYEHEKVRVIYKWIITNISYKLISNPSLNATWKSRKTICSGYVDLFSEMLTECNIKSLIVEGDADNGTPDDSEHAWTSILLSGQEYWFDATWGTSGYDYYAKLPSEMLTHKMKRIKIDKKSPN